MQRVALQGNFQSRSDRATRGCLQLLLRNQPVLAEQRLHPFVRDRGDAKIRPISGIEIVPSCEIRRVLLQAYAGATVAVVFVVTQG